MKTRYALGTASLGAVAIYLLVVKGALTLDTGVGRRTGPLGPIQFDIGAPPEIVFEIISTPYLAKTPHAMESKLRVLERGSDMVLAEHFTPVGYGLKASTVEAVRFDRPTRITFRLVRGPVPYVTEAFELEASDDGTKFTYSGEIGAELLGSREVVVEEGRQSLGEHVKKSLADVTTEAERRVAPRATSD